MSAELSRARDVRQVEFRLLHITWDLQWNCRFHCLYFWSKTETDTQATFTSHQADLPKPHHNL